MSTEITYKCNLCGEKKDREFLFSIFYDSTLKVPPPVNFGAYRLDADVKKTDKHICFDCIEMIKKVS